MTQTILDSRVLWLKRLLTQYSLDSKDSRILRLLTKRLVTQETLDSKYVVSTQKSTDSWLKKLLKTLESLDSKQFDSRNSWLLRLVTQETLKSIDSKFNTFLRYSSRSKDSKSKLKWLKKLKTSKESRLKGQKSFTEGSLWFISKLRCIRYIYLGRYRYLMLSRYWLLNFSVFDLMNYSKECMILTANGGGFVPSSSYFDGLKKHTFDTRHYSTSFSWCSLDCSKHSWWLNKAHFTSSSRRWENSFILA